MSNKIVISADCPPQVLNTSGSAKIIKIIGPNMGGAVVDPCLSNSTPNVVRVITPGPKGDRGDINNGFTGSLQISGGLVVTGSGQFTNSITASQITASFVGNLSGTASWANNVATASYVLSSSFSQFSSTSSYTLNAQSSSYASTASYTLNVESASYALTSSFTNTTISASYADSALSASFVLQAFSSSYAVSSSISETALSSSFTQTSSYTLFAVSASYAPSSNVGVNGEQYYAAIFNTNTSIVTGSIYDSGSFAGIGSTGSIDPLNPERLLVDAGVTDSYNLISAHAEVNNYSQINIQNFSSGVSASSDIVATNNIGGEDSYYINMGINGDGYSIEGGIGQQNDAYLFSQAEDLLIGNAAAGKRLIFFNGEGSAIENARIFIVPEGTVGINATDANPSNPESLLVEPILGATDPSQFSNLIIGKGTIHESYLQLNMRNLGTGSLASTDIVATNDIGDEVGYYIDMGINSSNYSEPNLVGGPNDAYLYATGSHLHIGNATPGMPVMIFAGGLNSEENLKLHLGADNMHMMTGSLDVTGSLIVTDGITGSLFGTASWAENTLSASYSNESVTASYVDFSNIANKPTLFSGSSQVQLADITGTVFSNTQFTFPNDVVIEGNLTAEQLIISSSVYYVTTSFSSGSTIFGNSLDDTHQFTGSVSITGSLTIDGQANLSGVTSSVFGTASWSEYSSTSSFSYDAISSSFSTNAYTASYVESSSYSTTSSYSQNSNSASYALTASYWLGGGAGIIGGNGTTNRITKFTTTTTIGDSNIIDDGTKITITGSVIISSSLQITGSLYADDITGSLFGTSSWSKNSTTASYSNFATSSSFSANSSTASYVRNAVSSSFSQTASLARFAEEADLSFYAISASVAGTASWSTNAVTSAFASSSLSSSYTLTSSFSERAISSSFSINSLTASFALESVSSSNARTASYVEYTNVVNKPTLFSGSSQVQLGGITGTTFANTIYTFPNDLVVQGNLTAEQLIISSSIYYVTTSFSSGSTMFGNSLDDTHQFTGSVSITGSLDVVGQTSFSGITSSLFGTSSWSNYAETASYVNGNIFVGNNIATSASYAVTASFSQNSLTSSFVTGSIFVGTNVVRSSSFANTSSFAQNSLSSSFVSGNIFVGSNLVISSSYSITSSFSQTSFTASYLTGSIFNSTNPALSASYALTSSYSLNGGVTQIVAGGNISISPTNGLGIVTISAAGAAATFPYSGSAEITGSLGVTGSISVTNGGLTGSLLGTASFVTGSIFTGTNSARSSSYAVSTSFAQNALTASYVTGSIFVGSNSATSASYSVTSSFAQFALTASFALNAGTSVSSITNQIATGSVTASVNLNSSSLLLTSASTQLLVVSNSGLITGQRMLLSSSRDMSSGSTLTVFGSGSAQPIFVVAGSQGELFSISDSLSGSLFSVNDISGLPVMEVFSDNRILMGSYQAPSLHTSLRATSVLGSNVIFSNLPTSSYDGAFFDYIIRSGSNARAGQIMSLWSGSSVNFTEVVTTDFGDTSGVKFMVMITGSNMALTGSFPSASWSIKTIVRSI